MNNGVSNNKVYVVGHKNPDTDSICSAIAYADLKSKITGEDYSQIGRASCRERV